MTKIKTKKRIKIGENAYATVDTDISEETISALKEMTRLVGEMSNEQINQLVSGLDPHYKSLKQQKS